MIKAMFVECDAHLLCIFHENTHWFKIQKNIFEKASMCKWLLRVTLGIFLCEILLLPDGTNTVSFKTKLPPSHITQTRHTTGIVSCNAGIAHVRVTLGYFYVKFCYFLMEPIQCHSKLSYYHRTLCKSCTPWALCRAMQKSHMWQKKNCKFTWFSLLCHPNNNGLSIVKGKASFSI